MSTKGVAFEGRVRSSLAEALVEAVQQRLHSMAVDAMNGASRIKIAAQKGALDRDSVTVFTARLEACWIEVRRGSYREVLHPANPSGKTTGERPDVKDDPGNHRLDGQHSLASISSLPQTVLEQRNGALANREESLAVLLVGRVPVHCEVGIV